MTDRKKPGVAFWATALTVGLLVVYPLSNGPMRYAYAKAGEPYWFGVVIDVIYAPLWWLFNYTPEWFWRDVYGPYIVWWNSLA